VSAAIIVPGGSSANGKAARWGNRWAAWRNRWSADPRLQRWVAAFPPTRFFARRRARQTFDLVAGFVYSQVLQACVQLDMFALLRATPLSMAQIARELQLASDPARRLVEAAVALKLLERRGADEYGLGVLGAQLAGQPGVLAMIRHHAAFYADLTDPVALLRGAQRHTTLGEYWPYARTDEPAALPTEEVTAYTRLMSASQSFVAVEVLDAFDFAGVKCLLDVGGGDGTFLAAVASRHPRLELKLFDLPAVVPLAQVRLAGRGLEQRVQVSGGDFFRDELPRGADLISFVRVLHDHDDERVSRLLQAAARALAPGGAVLIAEPLAEAPGAETMGGAYFAFYLLAMGRGRARTAAELAHLLTAAGFDMPTEIGTRLPLQTGLLVARLRR
jgi:demethylspheroidene O-methyltransferase